MTAMGARVQGWMGRFSALVVARMSMPFAWGPNDCAAWSADAVQAQHGRDTLAELRGQRRCWREAQQQIRAGGGIPAALARAGLEPIAPAMAAVGDVVMLRQGRRRVLGICDGPVALVVGKAGLEPAPMRLAVAAWRV